MANVKKKTIGDQVGKILKRKPKINVNGLRLTRKIGKLFK